MIFCTNHPIISLGIAIVGSIYIVTLLNTLDENDINDLWR